MQHEHEAEKSDNLIVTNQLRDYQNEQWQAMTYVDHRGKRAEVRKENSFHDVNVQYPSRKKSCTLLLRHGLERVDKSILKSRENPFQLSMHFRVMELSPYLVVDIYGVNIQPNPEFTVLISCTSLIFLKYESKQAGRVFFRWS